MASRVSTCRKRHPMTDGWDGMSIWAQLWVLQRMAPLPVSWWGRRHWSKKPRPSLSSPRSVKDRFPGRCQQPVRWTDAGFDYQPYFTAENFCSDIWGSVKRHMRQSTGDKAYLSHPCSLRLQSDQSYIPQDVYTLKVVDESRFLRIDSRTSWSRIASVVQCPLVYHRSRKGCEIWIYWRKKSHSIWKPRYEGKEPTSRTLK